MILGPSACLAALTTAVRVPLAACPPVPCRRLVVNSHWRASRQWHLAVCLGVLLVTSNVSAQVATKEPHIGYVYPAGGQQGTSVEATLGGQHLDGVSTVIVSGTGVKATVLKHTKPLTQKRINDLRETFRKVQKQLQAQKKGGSNGWGTNAFDAIAKKMGVSSEELEAYKKLSDPKRQPNPQIAETVTLRLDFHSEAEPGDRELRLITKAGLTNPISFRVGQFAEFHEMEPNDKTTELPKSEPPFILNGQIMPGDVDRFRFKATKGMRLVMSVSAQTLIPFLADAVPGWFQATLALYDGNGQEVAYSDDYRFHPDPVLFYEVPEDGEYVLEIKDSIYRGREDFVYRITVGEVPFITSVFPMGARRSQLTTADLEGWNLPIDTLTLNTFRKHPDIYPISVKTEEWTSNHVPFVVGSLPEILEEEPNNDLAHAQNLDPPVVVNGRIDAPGDWDVFSFSCRAGVQDFAEVAARRLDSPLDSVLKLTDAGGRQLMVNDDHVDKGFGLVTHHADSRISFTAPEDGRYFLYLGDTQRKGGSAYTYRLGINAQSPSFQLRIAPPSINARAGSNALIHAFALRREGFSDDIRLELKDAPPGWDISGAWIPAGQDDVWLTLAVPPIVSKEPVRLSLEGRAVIDGMIVRRVAVPAEDMTQAFVKRHLVPAQDWMVSVTGAPRFKVPAKQSSGSRGATASRSRTRGRSQGPVAPSSSKPLRLPVGGTAVAEIPAVPAVLGMLDQVVLTLHEPPKGVTIQELSAISDGIAVRIHCEAGEAAEPGLKGNLIIEAATERTVGGGGNGPAKKRRSPLGLLPAIPFEIVASASGTASR